MGEFTLTCLITAIAWLFLQRMPSNLLSILLVAELWSVIFWYHSGFYAYQAKKKLIMSEEMDNMIFGKFGGAYHVCTKNVTSSLQKVIIIIIEFSHC